jgi:hypothetical protein
MLIIVSFSALTLSLPIGASAIADTTPPVAVITPLPEQVSNGTRIAVSGEESTDVGGIVTDYYWEIEHAGVVYNDSAKEFTYKFSELGLYTIKLTVTDGSNNSDVDFTAVYAILDSDFDDLPDWWEDNYFRDLDEDGAGDIDDDGYTNLQEYAAGTDPEVHDPATGVLEKYWPYFIAAGIATVAAALAMMPRLRRKRKQDEDAKIKAALEIEKALETED